MIRKFKIFRYDPDNGKGAHFQDFDVDAPEGMTVLEALYWVLENKDATLAFRSSCREANCGSCAMHIQNQYGLACKTQVSRLKDPITIRPLSHLPVVKDLVVDMKRFWNSYVKIKPYLIPKEQPPQKEYFQSVEDRRKIDHHIDCILCGACYGSCPVAQGDFEYLGPHALLKALRFVDDSRDGATDERLAMVATDCGVFRCHTIFNCQIVCPKDLNPTGAISKLKNKIMVKKYPFMKLFVRT